jgi:hypothetical protein
MFKIEPKLYLDPTPHIIIDDFITNEHVLNFLANNDELKKYSSGIPLGDYVRFEVCRESDYLVDSKVAGKVFYEDPRNINVENDIFSDKFKLIVDSFIEELLDDEDFIQMLRDSFNPVFEDFYPTFNETDFKLTIVKYGAYNSLEKPLETIGWHLDQGATLISGFLYLKEDDDESDDSALHLSKDTIESKRIKYINNRLVIWPNIPTAWHMAETRQPTKNLRRFFVFNCKSQCQQYHNYKTDKKENPDNGALYPWKDFKWKEVGVKGKKC